MNLAKGQTVYIGKEKFTGSIPDDKAKETGLLKEPKPEDAEKKEKAK